MSLESELLLAATGLFPKNIGKDEVRAAGLTSERWRQRLIAWVDSDEQAAFKFKDPPDMDKLLDKLVRDPTEADNARWIEQIGNGAGMVSGAKFAVELKRVRDYLVRIWPRLTIDDGAGPRLLPLSLDDALEAWSVYRVTEDPERIIDEMASQTLTASQAAAFRECYPELFRFADQTLQDAITAARAKDDEFALDSARQSVIRTLRGLPPEAIEPTKQPAPPPKQADRIKIGKEEGLTQAEVSAKP